MLVFPLLVYCMFLNVTLMTLMYGQQYSSSGIYFILKCISSLFAIVPYAPVFLALGHTKVYANIHMVIAILLILVQLVIVHICRLAVAVPIAYVVLEILKILLLLTCIKKYLRVKITDLIPLGKIFHITALALAAGTFMQIMLWPWHIDKIVKLFISCIIFIIAYFILAKITKLSYKELFTSVMPGRFGKLVAKIIP